MIPRARRPTRALARAVVLLTTICAALAAGGRPAIAVPSGLATNVEESRANVAIDAARSQLGVAYHYAMASPGHGFDCSGLAMWAWGQAGVALPHSSADQYGVLPHVDRARLQPGDLLFFYSPIHHVAIYLGDDLMIHAPHTGERVRIQHVYWRYFVGAARPYPSPAGTASDRGREAWSQSIHI